MDPIVVLTVDSLAADHVGWLGYHRDTTPRLDALSRRGTCFTTAIAQSSHTRESMPSLFFSRYPSRLPGVGPVPDQATLATALSSDGYVTAGFHSNPYLSRAYGFDRGFDRFDDSMPLARNRVVTFVHRAFNYLRTEPYVRAAELNEWALDWLIEREGDRRFCWVHYMDPHGPYQAPERFQSTFYSDILDRRSAKRLWRRMVDDPSALDEDEVNRLVDLYDAEIRYTDAMIGRFVDELDQRDWLDDGLLVVAADHGEAFGRRGTFGHPRQLQDELLHVPLVVVGEGVPTDRRVERPVENVDVAPTVLELTNCPVPNSFEGFRLPWSDGDVDELDPVVFASCRGEGDEAERQRFAARTIRYLYAVEFNESGEELSNSLYDLQRDGATDGELTDIGDTRPEVRDTLAERALIHYEKGSPRSNDSKRSSVSKSDSDENETHRVDDSIVEDRLRDLGYR